MLPTDVVVASGLDADAAQVVAIDAVAGDD
jgi:hypothetical protein